MSPVQKFGTVCWRTLFLSPSLPIFRKIFKTGLSKFSYPNLECWRPFFHIPCNSAYYLDKLTDRYGQWTAYSSNENSTPKLLTIKEVDQIDQSHTRGLINFSQPSQKLKLGQEQQASKLTNFKSLSRKSVTVNSWFQPLCNNVNWEWRYHSSFLLNFSTSIWPMLRSALKQ